MPSPVPDIPEILVRLVRLATCASLALAAATANATNPPPLFDFANASRTLISTAAPARTPADFAPAPGFPLQLFTVGNLLNGCGLFPSAGIASATKTGTGCVQSAHDTTSPVENLAKKIEYTDSFTLAADTRASFQLIVKLGHPEWPQSKNQNQLERFDVYLQGPGGKVLLTRFLDDVDSGDGEEDDAYYRYVYAAGLLPAGTWRPVFESRDGSVEFLATLAAVPEPGTMALLAFGLAALLIVVRSRG